MGQGIGDAEFLFLDPFFQLFGDPVAQEGHYGIEQAQKRQNGLQVHGSVIDPKGGKDKTGHQYGNGEPLENGLDTV